MTHDASWPSVRNYAEPIVAEIDSPEETLLDLRIIIPGNDAVSLSAEFPFVSQNPDHNARLLKYAAKLLQDAATRQRGRAQ